MVLLVDGLELGHPNLGLVHLCTTLPTQALYQPNFDDPSCLVRHVNAVLRTVLPNTWSYFLVTPSHFAHLGDIYNFDWART